jgi:hypothetical protein
MVKLDDTTFNRCKPNAAGEKPEFFSTDIKPLVLSHGCQRLNKLPYNVWVFQLIEIYQGKKGFQQVAQVWHFNKTEQEIQALCEDPQEHVLAFLGIDLFEFHHHFHNLILCVAGGRCMLKEEHDNALAVLPNAQQQRCFPAQNCFDR